jgi:hypothetical protein
MHLTWQPGDPVIQLNFPNPLNVSVQVGDVAYFSNPDPVGQSQSWTATTTPHLSNPQGGIIMIGEIIQIIPWDGTVSSIICNMPQLLFNQYFAQINVNLTCTITGSSTCTSSCCNFDTSYHPSVTVPQNYNIGPQSGMELAWRFFFDNPTLSMGANSLGGPNCYMVHEIVPTPSIYDSVSVSNNWCLLDNNHPNYVPGHINYWKRMGPFNWTDESGGTWGPFLTAGIFTDFLMGLYPTAGFFQGMSFDDLVNARNNIPGFPPGVGWSISSGGGPINGTYSDTFAEICTGGSFIMFSKDNKVNMSDMLGYYASVELRNSSKTEAKLFNVGTTFFESSK